MKRTYRSISGTESDDLPDLVDVAKQRAIKRASQKEFEDATDYDKIQDDPCTVATKTSGPPTALHGATEDVLYAVKSTGRSKSTRQTSKDDPCTAIPEPSRYLKSSRQTPKDVPCATTTEASGRLSTLERTSKDVPCTAATKTSRRSKSMRPTSRDVPCTTSTETSRRSKSVRHNSKYDPCTTNTESAGRLKLLRRSPRDGPCSTSTELSGRLKTSGNTSKDNACRTLTETSGHLKMLQKNSKDDPCAKITEALGRSKSSRHVCEKESTDKSRLLKSLKQEQTLMTPRVLLTDLKLSRGTFYSVSSITPTVLRFRKYCKCDNSVKVPLDSRNQINTTTCDVTRTFLR